MEGYQQSMIVNNKGVSGEPITSIYSGVMGQSIILTGKGVSGKSMQVINIGISGETVTGMYRGVSGESAVLICRKESDCSLMAFMEGCQDIL
jgi:hypothetical protein